MFALLSSEMTDAPLYWADPGGQHRARGWTLGLNRSPSEVTVWVSNQEKEIKQIWNWHQVRLENSSQLTVCAQAEWDPANACSEVNFLMWQGQNSSLRGGLFRQSYLSISQKGVQPLRTRHNEGKFLQNKSMLREILQYYSGYSGLTGGHWGGGWSSQTSSDLTATLTAGRPCPT